MMKIIVVMLALVIVSVGCVTERYDSAPLEAGQSCPRN